MVKAKAFTLMEVIVVIGIIALSTAILLPYSLSQIDRSTVSNTADNLESLVFLQQQNAYSYKNNQSYGIYFDMKDIYLYQGDSYSAALEATKVDIDKTVGIIEVNLNDGGRDINFQKGSFKPSSYGTVNIGKERVSYQIIINQQGLIDVQKI